MPRGNVFVFWFVCVVFFLFLCVTAAIFLLGSTQNLGNPGPSAMNHFVSSFVRFFTLSVFPHAFVGQFLRERKKKARGFSLHGTLCSFFRFPVFVADDDDDVAKTRQKPTPSQPISRTMFRNEMLSERVPETQRIRVLSVRVAIAIV